MHSPAQIASLSIFRFSEIVKIARVVELLWAPFITIKAATAQRAIERLERASIVKCVGDAKSDRVHCATALLDIREEPARLKAT